MGISELRIGNYLSFVIEGSYCVVNGVSLLDNIVTSTGVYGNNADRGIEDFSPINLTEEWLVKFGFVKYLNSFGNNGFNIHLAEQGYFFWIWNHEQVIIKTVHQLQNLYFAITKVELKYSE